MVLYGHLVTYPGDRGAVKPFKTLRGKVLTMSHAVVGVAVCLSVCVCDMQCLTLPWAALCPVPGAQGLPGRPCLRHDPGDFQNVDWEPPGHLPPGGSHVELG